MSFKKYDLTKEQLVKITRLCNQEQGSVKGCRAEASLMANLFEKQSDYKTLYEYVRYSGWFYNAGFYMDKGEYSSEQYSAVFDVLVNGNRFFPAYIDEHDCLLDIDYVYNPGEGKFDKNDRSKYIKGKTIVHQDTSRIRGGGSWTFYCFPDTGCDPFGYTTKPSGESEIDDHNSDYYEPCVEIGLSEVSFGDYGKDVLIAQKMLRMGGFKGTGGKLLPLTGKFDLDTKTAVESCQKKHGLVVDAIVGKNTWRVLFNK